MGELSAKLLVLILDS